jgi:dihydroorotate dehydrogenase
MAFNSLFDYADYFAVNLSSPNTPNLRELQEKDSLEKILSELVHLNKSKIKPKPILLKIAPDLNNQQLDDILEIVQKTQIDGIIATNTTISRKAVSADEIKLSKIGQGGLSGKPLTEKSTEIIRYLSKKSEGKIPIVASGGIMSADDAAEKISAGASLVQIYTGFIYEGPALIKEISKKLISG